MMTKEKILQAQKQITGKLTAAIAMLLVSSILMCLTSYAWFVLSTAPELTGMTTTAGANGALEIALQSTNKEGTARAEILSAVGSSSAKAGTMVANTHWGNIVDLSSGYGLEHVTLYPSRLDVESMMVGDKASYSVRTNSILSAPTFGEDGRLVKLERAGKTHYNATGENAGKFTDNANWGVNVIGFAKNGAEAEDNSFVRAYSRANVLAEATQKVATYRTNLRAEMEDLIARNSVGIFGVMALLIGMNLLTEEQLMATATDYVLSMDAMIGDAADAVRWALLANAAADSDYKSESEDDMRELGKIYKNFLQYPLFSDNEDEITVESIARNKYPEIAEAASTIATVQARIDTALRDLKKGTVVGAASALVKLNESFMYGIHAGTGVADQRIDVALGYDFAVGAPTDTVFMVATPGANPIDVNLFSSLATVLGDYRGTMTVWVGATMNMVGQKPADEKNWNRFDYDIKATNASTYAGWRDVSDLSLAEQGANIGVLGAVYQNVSSKTATGDILMPITRSDITAYGYSADFAFRASENTSLRLQQDAVDRVSGSEGDDRLQGGGSTMTFTLAGGYTHEQAEKLMECIHIVFMNTANGNVYKVAAADPSSINVELDTATATLQVYEPVFASDGTLTLGAKSAGNVIIDMVKDTAYYITAVVYLNGDLTDGGMLSSNEALSLDGSINLQFSSTYELQPMNYSPYYTAPSQDRRKENE